ncbi:4-fold beta flower protein [Aureivirga sp. CE67]|uniref:4-fold beta flower protein n=1 Tax=Aureivirga sp. CE67 TaxID=1788983 RepID=UPI0018CA4EB7|nr:hypothetical protein [Aureivirga sp. CE67]
MKTKTITILLFLFSFIQLSAQQITLYNKQDKPVAYIDYDEEVTIFLWNGTPVAFLEEDGDDNLIYGFNGKFMGWYEEGAIYDEKGNVVGVQDREDKIRVKIEPIKGIQGITPIRPISLKFAPMKPIWSRYWSSTPLVDFLSFGKRRF